MLPNRLYIEIFENSCCCTQIELESFLDREKMSAEQPQEQSNVEQMTVEETAPTAAAAPASAAAEVATDATTVNTGGT